MMKYLQKLGKSLMLPVAVLPIAGILSGLGYLLCPASMQGGEITGAIPLIGYFMVQAALAIIDGPVIALLFAVGVGIGMSDDHDGTAALAGLVSWLMITKLLSTGVVTTLIPSVAEDASKTIAFNSIQNAFIGILAGIIGSTCYNKFKNTKLPDFLAFFSGKRCVAIVTAVVSIVAAAILLFVWPIIFGGLVALGNGILSMGAIGAGIYAFLNRLLIPVGLHHALNNVFWFPTIGIGDLTHFWAGETSAQVGWDLGMYMSGFFPCMMFGIPGAALAMIHTAKTNKRKVAVGIVASAALCAFICGVTEPFEFAFMFLAPLLYVAYALLYGIFTFITVLVGFRAGFSFSAGATDLLFSASLPAAANTWMIIPLGIAAFAVFYLVFRFAITKFDLKTPGREDDDEDETKVVLSNNDFTEVARVILEGLGGAGNVTSVDNCITRLRLEIKDYTQVNEKLIKSAGVAGVMRPSKTSVQVIVGTQVQHVADEFKKLMK
ncbi:MULTISPECIES: PTS transporter subunit EIIC [Oscillospiraceae]|uniref:PTS system N-acetylglucosamine-specific IIB component (Glc family) /PTS system N-acetylglucosamine-specific IIC component (Glc family) n=1 Tax=Harryflintia acetispora TaxID=1849041 RepID=A0A9X8UJH8_9FIRM|nr:MULTISPECIES: PTS transporter subunit EIIC [Oscillospiraceae]RGB68321.1 PTS glucose transporter subunit IIBC [Harryflintia acetispora]TCL43749.1 PTS system N-acetylglucosamine-specific IIB component (Glc family) /PTS system N-acetylglucosamine-specific IIC component (Glc family) [Harryflintia acetispora]